MVQKAVCSDVIGCNCKSICVVFIPSHICAYSLDKLSGHSQLCLQARPDLQLLNLLGLSLAGLRGTFQPSQFEKAPKLSVKEAKHDATYKLSSREIADSQIVITSGNGGQVERQSAEHKETTHMDKQMELNI